MKVSYKTSFGLLPVFALVIGLTVQNGAVALSAQVDSIVQIMADAQGLVLVPPNQAPRIGTYWLFMPGPGGGIAPPMPCPPLDPGLPIYAIASGISGGQFLVDGTIGGQAAVNTTQAKRLANLEAQANAVVNLITWVQTTAANQQMRAMGMNIPAFDGGDARGTDDYEYSFTTPVYTTNDLWLSIGTTNTITGLTAYLTIHKPWNDTNLFHDLYFTTNLAAPNQWGFVMRCPYTNAVVTDLTSPVGFFRLGPATNGDLTVTTNATAQQLAQLLVPPWVVVTNATYTGAVVARGVFTNGNGCGLPINNGVILSTGCITNAIGPNNDAGFIAAGYRIDSFNFTGPSDLWQPGDTNLDSLVGGGPTFDAAVLEFDIVSTNSFTLQLQYIFASEEYPEYISYYNDPMAIFVSTNRVGTNWVNSISNDLALVPGTTNVPVSVNNINGGCNGVLPTNPQYYVDNHDPYNSALPPYAVAAPVFNIQYDGMTVQLTVQASIAANVTNHVKIAIADYGDTVYDSAVFLKAWSPSNCQ